MKKNLFSIWVFLLAVFWAADTNAQATIGNKTGTPKAAEAFSALEIISNGTGGLRLPQLTTTQRNALAVSQNALASGLTIFNSTTNCVEYWNNSRWISLCDGTSQTTISPSACTNVAADGTGCDLTFDITDPDCPNGPFKITIIAGNEYASLTDVDEANGSYKVKFNQNESVSTRSVVVRIVSTCTTQFKDFIYMQDGVICTPLGTAPAVSPSSANLTLCAGGAVYLSVPAGSANLDKLIWTRNGIEVARGVNYYVATLKGTYNVSLGAAGCNVSASNERIITDGGTAPAPFTNLIASNNGIMCGSTGSVTLTLAGATGAISWFKNGELQSGKTGASITVTGTAEAGLWFAAAGTAGCYSKPSNSVTVTVNTASTPITVNLADVLVNNKPINTVTSFCTGGSLTLLVNNPQTGVTYTWYNGQNVITSPYIVPAQSTMKLRMVATDNTEAKCPAEASTTEITVTSGATPGMPTITGAGVICDGSADLTIIPAETGTYTYQWYKDGVLLPVTTQTITATELGAVYNATVATASGCTSPYATKKISNDPSSLPVLSWKSGTDTAYFNDKLTYQVDIKHDPATYVWTADGGATVAGIGSSATVTFPASGTEVHVKVKATNSCGTSTELDKLVTLSNACPTPVVTASPTQFSVTANTAATMKVTVTQANTTIYQWYSNTTATNSGGTAISGATSATYVYTPTTAGNYYFYCIVKNGCTGTPQATNIPVFTVTATQDPSTLTLGSGTFTGKTCFDINKSNDGPGCGTNASRVSTATDFTTQFAQPYIFTASTTGVKSNLRFVIVDPVGTVESTTAATAAVPGSIANGQAVTLTVNYKKTLNDVNGLIYGRTTTQAAKVKIYAVYFDGTKDVAVLLTVSIQDCACCGAYIAPNVWKEFMCLNLGAVETADPFVPSKEINGAYYMVGNKLPFYKAPQDGDGLTGNPMNTNTTWTGTTTKGDNDPCPAGYRIPTEDEWRGVIKNNTSQRSSSGTQSATNFTGYIKYGQRLLLPFSAHVSGLNPVPPLRGTGAYYPIVRYDANSLDALNLYNYTGDIIYLGGVMGGTVRCIAQ
jgi:hypothetical protein